MRQTEGVARTSLARIGSAAIVTIALLSTPSPAAAGQLFEREPTVQFDGVIGQIAVGDAYAGRNHKPPSSALRRLRLVKTITGGLTPKSVVTGPGGLVFAQNMIYAHTVTVYDAASMRWVKTIPDRVRLSRHGFPQYEGSYQGGPVEAAFSPDGEFVYVTNYSMYGPDLRHPGSDSCSPSSGIDPSFVYRINTETLRIGRVIKVGQVPKVVATTPDGRFVLVTNWCGYDLSVISTKQARQVKRIPIGRYPRGIAVDERSRMAYVAVMGSYDIAKVSLKTFGVRWIRGVGSSPRALVLDPDGEFLYATLNGAGTVVKIDRDTDRVVDTVRTGVAPRSMAIAPDGKSLYVVNYESNTVSNVRTRDMQVVQTVSTNVHPIGIAYDARHQRVWVACYSGSLMVFKNAPPN